MIMLTFVGNARLSREASILFRFIFWMIVFNVGYPGLLIHTSTVDQSTTDSSFYLNKIE